MRRSLVLLKMAAENLLKPPVSVRGMNSLDKDAFTLRTVVPALRLRSIDVARALGATRHAQLRGVPGLKLVQHDLSTVGSAANPPSIAEFAKETANTAKSTILLDRTRFVLEEMEEKMKILSLVDWELIEKEISLEFNNWSINQIMSAILPEGIPAVRGFSQIGHIVHVNLRDQHLPFKHIIGQVLLEKIATCRTVVNKLETIDNQFRNFRLELLAGEEDYEATVKEEGFIYKFDFSKVFWNPRLSTEHTRLIKHYLKPNSVVYDVFAGIGPFAIPAASRGKNCTVLANDLNPDSVRYMKENATLNKVNISEYNLDGSEFIRTVISKDVQVRDESTCACHCIMNLPAIAVEFLDTFAGILPKEHRGLKFPFYVHCYLFSKADDFVADAKAQVKKHLLLGSNSQTFKLEHDSVDSDATGKSTAVAKCTVISNSASDDNRLVYSTNDATTSESSNSDKPSISTAVAKTTTNGELYDIVDIYHVRNVAPKKEMMCVSIQLSSNYLRGNFSENGAVCESTEKKRLTEPEPKKSKIS